MLSLIWSCLHCGRAFIINFFMSTSKLRQFNRSELYTPELANDICETIATTFRGLNYHCKRKEDWPTSKTIRSWLFKNSFPEFTKAYNLAKTEQAENMAEEIIDVSYRADGKTKFGVDKVRVQVDALKWVAAKLKPKKYSEKIVQEHTGADGEPIKIESNKMDLTKLTNEELMSFQALVEKVTLPEKKD